MDKNALMVAVLAMLAVGGVFYVFVYPYLSGEAQAAKRTAAMSKGGAVKKAKLDKLDSGGRRKQVLETLKEIENRNKSKKLTIDQKLLQAGIVMPKEKFFMIAAGAGLGLGVLSFLVAPDPLIALGIMVVAAAGMPFWVIAHMRKRRVKKFVDEFPNAVEVIIRGIKAGLPLGDCIRVIASEAAEPVRTEFRHIVETQQLGLSMGEAVDRITERVPTAEANFFAIVINIQQKAGGNLSEALGNLAKVLRDRKKMKGKIQAMSSEAKASAGIIGCLPLVVGGLVYLTSPKYIELLWTTPTGQMTMAGCAIWMGIGIAVMKKMISFDF